MVTPFFINGNPVFSNGPSNLPGSDGVTKFFFYIYIIIILIIFGKSRMIMYFCCYFFVNNEI